MGERIGTSARLARSRKRTRERPRPGAPPRASRRCAVARRRCTTTREFFRARNVLEVETPAMVNAPVSDVNIGSVRVADAGRDATPLYLHTSPEYAMKRLLAAGSGDIFQVCHVFRGAERGRQHNPEFTMVEWYRLGFSLEAADARSRGTGARVAGRGTCPWSSLSYREAVLRHAGFDPLDADDDALQRAAQSLGLDAQRARAAGRDELLDLIVGAQVGPALGAAALTFVHRYPGVAGRAGAPRCRGSAPRVALRALSSRRGTGQWLPRAHQRGRTAHALRCRSAVARGARPAGGRARSAPAGGTRGRAARLRRRGARFRPRADAGAWAPSNIDEVLAFPTERA